MSDVTCDVVADHVAMVCLRRPPNNFFDTELLRELADVYEEVAATSWCRAIVLSSEGRHFCAGLDFATNQGQDIAALYGHAIRLFAAPLPVVAAVQGAAVGGGFGLALSADFRIASPSSRFSANFARLGFHHGFGMSVTLPHAGGRDQQAGGSALSPGRMGRGEEARARRICDDLVAEANLLESATTLARAIAASGPLAVRSIRSTLRGGLVERLSVAMDHECAEQERLRHTSDFAEGLRASAARRDPDFSGA